MKKTIYIFLFFTLMAYSSRAQTYANFGPAAVSVHSGGGASASGYGAELYNDSIIPVYGGGGTYEWGWVNSNGWIEYTWSSEVMLVGAHFHVDNRQFTNMTIQYHDGTNYVDIATGINATGLQDLQVMFPSMIMTSKLRFFNIAGSNPNFREIEALGFWGELDDAGVESLVSPLGDYCEGVQDIGVRVVNFGRNPVQYVDLYWSLNGVLQTPVSITTTIDSMAAQPDNYLDIHLGSFHIPYGVNTEVKAWTHMPNSVVDSFNDNDTLLAIFSAPREGIIFPPMVDTTICEGDTVLFNPQGLQSNVYYAWSHGHVGSDAPISQAGTYWVLVYNDDACENSDTFTVSMESLPTAVAVTGNNVSDKNFIFNLIGAENADIVNWDFGDGSTQTGSGSFSHEYQTDGAYTVKVTLSNYCGEIELSLEVAAGNVGLSDLDLLARQILLYPNPAQDIVTVENKSEARMNGLKVYDVLGKLVFDSGSFDGTKVSLDLSAFSSGVYQLRISTTEGEVRKQLQVLK